MSIEKHDDLSKYAAELRSDGGNANFLKLRAEERKCRTSGNLLTIRAGTNQTKRVNSGSSKRDEKASVPRKKEQLKTTVKFHSNPSNVQSHLPPQLFARQYARQTSIFVSSDLPRNLETLECWDRLRKLRGDSSHRDIDNGIDLAHYTSTSALACASDQLNVTKARGRSRSPRKVRNSQGSKPSQQLTPQTSSRASSPNPPQTRSSSVPISDWSVSDRGDSPSGTSSDLEEAEAETKKSSFTPLSPFPAQHRKSPSLSSPLTASSKPNEQLRPLPLAPPPPTQPRRPTRRNDLQPCSLKDVLEFPNSTFNFDSSLSVKEVPPIRVGSLMAMQSPPRAGPVRSRAGSDDGSAIPEAIPESSQFHPPPLTRHTSSPSSFRADGSVLSPNKSASVATAPSILFHRMVQRKIPPPRQPIPPRMGSPARVLVPNSDTSGTQSQSQSLHDSQSQSQTRSQPQEQQLSNHPQSHLPLQPPPETPTYGAFWTESGTQLLNTAQEVSAAMESQVHEARPYTDDDDDDHDSLFSGPDSDQLTSPEDDDLIGGTSLEVHPGTQPHHSPDEDTAGIVRPPSELCAPGSRNQEAKADCDHRDCHESEAMVVSSSPSNVQKSLDSRASASLAEIVVGCVIHEPEAWVEPTFLRLRRERTVNTRPNHEMQGGTKTFREDKSKVNVGITAMQGKPRSRKRSHSDQNDSAPSKKKRKKEVSGDRQREPDFLPGFSADLDEVPAGEPFMSWDRLKDILLKVGRVRSAQQARS
ncbi:hypothetical protein GYMLUDRAFT_69239 [Collybiopsis luxurians FD-317 M1]|nr:hypothetical protein GYMLUDRAFT_69239 [Collybiopsis luxurians FD-317 M1]